MDFSNKAARQDYLRKLEILEEVGEGVTLPINISDVKDLENQLSKKVDDSHKYEISDIEGLEDALNSKGTSNLVIGTVAGTAKEGNWIPPVATTSVAGIVKQMAAIEDVEDAVTADDFNSLLAKLRDSGLLQE